MDSSSIRWPTDHSQSNLLKNSSSKDFDIQLSMIPPDDDDIATNGRSVNISRINNIKSYVEESTFVRPDSLKSSSILKLADMLSQNILLHPFVALRRTCQVNRKCSPYICIQPFSLMSFMYHQQRKQGVTALYKGLSSELLVKGMTLGTMTALANYADWPTEVSGSKRYFEDLVKVMILKGSSIALCTPFLCSTVIETVQSVIVVKDRPAFYDCLKEGFLRLLHIRSTPSTRIIPIWLLIVPTVCYHLTHSFVRNLSEKFVTLFRSNIRSAPSDGNKYSQSTNQYTSKRLDITTGDQTVLRQGDFTSMLCDGSIDASSAEIDDIESDSNKISTSILACLITDIALLPIETVLNGLYIQGTRTIIDNCDETTVVLPVLTNYDGFSDCYQSILKFEGNLGLYKGLGAIILQYSVQFILFRSLYYLLREFNNTGGRSRNIDRSIAGKGQPVDKVKSSIRHMQNARHSTPNNPMGVNNRFNVNDDSYGLEKTPRRYRI